MDNAPRKSRSFALRVISTCALITAALLGAGCAGLPASNGNTAPPSPRAQDTPEARQCRLWFSRLDQAVQTADVADAEFTPVPGYPFLRVNRHTQALGSEAVTPRQQAEWLWRLRALDQQARRSELARLPLPALASLQRKPATSTPATPAPAVNSERHRTAMLGLASDCGDRLTRRLLGQPGIVRQLRLLAFVPDRYSSGMRALGLYPLSSLAVGAGVRRWEADTRHGYASASHSQAWPAFGNPQIISPESLAPEIAALPTDALGVPQVNERLQQQMLDAFSPVFQIEQASAFDQPGTVTIDAHGLAAIDTANPGVYRRLAFTRYRGRSLIQLVYTIWFSERPATGALDIYAGMLDGVVLRITLGRQGLPVVVDTIHPCGCYHQFFAADNVRLREPPAGLGADDEWRFMPGPPLSPAPGQRLHVAVTTGSHYVTKIEYRPLQTSTGSLMALRNYDERTLTRLADPPDQIARSLYTSTGMVGGTERLERWLLWPMGIRSAGAMRQWGHHATAFVGLRHFDDADLIERRFILP